MMKKIFFVASVVLCFMNMQCNDDDGIDPSLFVCDQAVVVDKEVYDNLDSAHFTLVNAEISNNCLTIEISASGCDGNSWEFNLIDSGAIAESSPEQRYLKLQLVNKEACLAVFKRTVSFDLTPLQVSGSREIILHLKGLESSLNYKY
ncbi:hypothetical protein [Flavivirga algicola]|uniref:Lipocalin-like domain-containing protein n=1 Tax=Flavivirga algicola TaxID=2729136 RepID=A0ABX1S4L0_9FLAO|nr:hypothetical protein [Flavivirga algicola]NMH89808.1 hypothetical protein [Flavivirga algicola]